MWKREWTWLKLKDKADTHKWHQWWHCRPNADSIRRGISNGTAGRTQTAIAEPGWKRVPTSECVTARAAKGSSRDKHNEPATLSGSGGPRFLVLQQLGFTSSNCSKPQQGSQYLRRNSCHGVYGFCLSLLGGSWKPTWRNLDTHEKVTICEDTEANQPSFHFVQWINVQRANEPHVGRHLLMV